MTAQQDDAHWLAEIQAMKKAMDRQAEEHHQALEKINRSLTDLQQIRADQQQIMRHWLLGLLEIYDGFCLAESTLKNYQPVKRLFRHSRPEDVRFIRNFQQGHRISLRRLERLMEQYQLKPIECLNKPFDPKLMVAVEVTHQPTIEQGQVLAVYRSGFYWQGQVLRAAEVKVNRTGAPHK
jgi:molecular chaperone GrpE